jgi:hypothetical protein
VPLLAILLVILAACLAIHIVDKEPVSEVTNLTAVASIPISAEALEIHSSGMLWDGHNDLPWKVKTQTGLSDPYEEINESIFDEYDIAYSTSGHTDIPRLL